MRIITIYQTESDWCALVELDGGMKATLTFAAQPSEADVEALAAAREALSQADTPRNQDIMEQARKRASEDVSAKLNAMPWTRDVLYEAATLAKSALDADPGSDALVASPKPFLLAG